MKNNNFLVLTKMIKVIPLIIFFQLFFIGFLHAGFFELAVINDKDGYTNIRDDTTTNSKIIGKVLENEIFIFRKTEGDWWNTRGANGNLVGYIHKSRVAPLKELPIIRIKPLFKKDWKKTYRQYTLENTSVEFYQARKNSRGRNENPPYFCSSYLQVTNSKGNMKYKHFPDIEPVGGWMGVWHVKHDALKNFIFFVKHGDYDGRTIIIDNLGDIYDIEGGLFTIYKNYVISIYCTDGNIYPIVWDLHKRNKTYDLSKDDSLPGEFEGREYKFFKSSNSFYLELFWGELEDRSINYYKLTSDGKFMKSTKKLNEKYYVELKPSKIELNMVNVR